MSGTGSIRVLRAVTRLNIGGPSRHVLTLHHGLRERGYDTVLAVGSAEPHEGDMLEWQEADVVRVSGLRRASSATEAARAAMQLRRIIRSYRPHIVHSHMAMAGLTARLAARSSSPRPLLVHTFHGHLLEGYFSPARSRAYTVVERVAGRLTDRLVAVSEHVGTDLQAMGIGAAGRWNVIEVGLDLDALCELSPDLPGTSTVGVIGRLVPIKDHQTLFRAISRLPAEVTLVVAGDGELREELQRLSRDLDIDDRVRFVGWVRDLPALLSQLDAVVLSSRNEGTPVSLIEAMAAARPVVATRVGGVADVVQDGMTGLLVAPEDPAVLAEAIHTVLDDPLRARAMGTAGRAAVRDRFTTARLVDDVDRLYRHLLSSR